MKRAWYVHSAVPVPSVRRRRITFGDLPLRVRTYVCTYTERNRRRVTPESGRANIRFVFFFFYSFLRRVSGGPADRRVITNK